MFEPHHQRASAPSSYCLAGTSSWAGGFYWSPRGVQLSVQYLPLHTDTNTHSYTHTPEKPVLQTKQNASLQGFSSLMNKQHQWTKFHPQQGSKHEMMTVTKPARWSMCPNMNPVKQGYTNQDNQNPITFNKNYFHIFMKNITVKGEQCFKYSIFTCGIKCLQSHVKGS